MSGTFLTSSTMSYEWPGDFWEHQRTGCRAIVDAIARGKRRLVFTAPCGTGKTRCMTALIEWASTERWDSIVYTHRRLLLSQTSGVLTQHGIDHGMRAAGHKPALLRSVQLAMIQSEFPAVFKKQRRELHPANFVLTDELHANGGEMLQTIHQAHYDRRAAIVGFTATPLDLEGEWDELIVACTTSEGRKCGALVPAVTYCPDEPDMRHIKNYQVGEDLTDKQNRQVMMRPGIFGRVYEHWERLNPQRKPTILFAPDVAGSIYFAEEFHKHGVRSAHIDAKQIWLNGEYMASSDENRAQIIAAVRNGDIQVLTNRFVLREGIDIPEVAHAIFACVVGSLRSWLQMGGRAIRHHPTTPEVIIQDHGANYRRHGSLNGDRAWELDMKGHVSTGLRQEQMREHPEQEPIRCPQCGLMRLSGPVCHQCGCSSHKRSRMVVQIDGSLHCVEGPTFTPQRIAMKKDTAAQWERMYYRAKSKKWDATFQQAAAQFLHENHYSPPRDLALMPREPIDWFSRIQDVPQDRLNQ